MAVGDKVRAVSDIPSFVQKGQSLKFAANAIPQGTFGAVIQEDLKQQVVVVKFDNGVTGVFGAGSANTPDTITLIEVVTTPSGSLL